MDQLQQTINSREVAKMVGREHYDVMKDIRRIVEQLGEGNFPLSSDLAEVKIGLSEYFIESTYKNSQNKELPCYDLTKKGCELYSTRMTGAKGTQFAVAYIEKFNQMENHIKQQLPATYKEALLHLVEQVEINEKLEERALVAEQANLELKPKALFADSVSASHTSILVGELAKLIKQNGVSIGANRLFGWLRDKGYLIKRKGASWNMPTQLSMEQGLFEIKETVISHSDGHTSISKTPKVTGKGQIYFVNKFLDEKQTA